MPLGVRYRVRNPDGSISTVRTISIGVDGGEVVLPTVINGRIVSDEEAIAHYERTGENFGTFRNPQEAKAFSEWLHNQHERELRPQSRTGYNAFHRAVIGQESGGQYGVANAQGSGAMGIGQIMPETARALSQRLGLPYRPDLLAGTSPAARQYQDRLTAAATREAWDYGNGDPRTAAMYYHGGSNRDIWGPKTRRYADDILGRLGAR